MFTEHDYPRSLHSLQLAFHSLRGRDRCLERAMMQGIDYGIRLTAVTQKQVRHRQKGQTMRAILHTNLGNGSNGQKRALRLSESIPMNLSKSDKTKS
jgi:hypothetical protein